MLVLKNLQEFAIEIHELDNRVTGRLCGRQLWVENKVYIWLSSF